MSIMKPIYLDSSAHLYRFTTTTKNPSLQYLIVTLNFIYCYYCRVFILFVLSVVIITVLLHPNVIKLCVCCGTMPLPNYNGIVDMILVRRLDFLRCAFAFFMFCHFCSSIIVRWEYLCACQFNCPIYARNVLYAVIALFCTYPPANSFGCYISFIKSMYLVWVSSPANKINAKPHFKDIMCEFTYWARWYMA